MPEAPARVILRDLHPFSRPALLRTRLRMASTLKIRLQNLRLPHVLIICALPDSNQKTRLAFHAEPLLGDGGRIFNEPCPS
jgi:hypothetical protein